jgi:hypothetical protein
LPARLKTLLARPARSDDAETRPAADASPTGYTTFSAKLAPGLTVAGGLLTLLGGLGAWIRTSQIVVEGFTEEQAGVVMGHEAGWGRVLGVLGALVTLSAIAWVGSRLLLKVVPLALSLAIVALVAWRLPIIDEQAQAFADQALTGDASFVVYHAGFGWGAWCLIVAALCLFIGVTAGVLRELDLRRGVRG